jgi:hypothetical protein
LAEKKKIMSFLYLKGLISLCIIPANCPFYFITIILLSIFIYCQSERKKITYKCYITIDLKPICFDLNEYSHLFNDYNCCIIAEEIEVTSKYTPLNNDLSTEKISADKG